MTERDRDTETETQTESWEKDRRRRRRREPGDGDSTGKGNVKKIVFKLTVGTAAVVADKARLTTGKSRMCETTPLPGPASWGF